MDITMPIMSREYTRILCAFLTLLFSLLPGRQLAILPADYFFRPTISLTNLLIFRAENLTAGPKKED